MTTVTINNFHTMYLVHAIRNGNTIIHFFFVLTIIFLGIFSVFRSASHSNSCFFLFMLFIFAVAHSKSIHWKLHCYQANSCIHSHLFINVICTGNFPNHFIFFSLVHCSECIESYFVYTDLLSIRCNQF